MAEMSFEKALENLEKIVEDLESGGFTLDTALKKYEEGIKMARLCREKLDTAKARIEVLTKEGDGQFGVSPLEGEKGAGKKGKKEK